MPAGGDVGDGEGDVVRFLAPRQFGDRGRPAPGAVDGGSPHREEAGVVVVDVEMLLERHHDCRPVVSGNGGRARVVPEELAVVVLQRRFEADLVVEIVGDGDQWTAATSSRTQCGATR